MAKRARLPRSRVSFYGERPSWWVRVSTALVALIGVASLVIAPSVTPQPALRHAHIDVAPAGITVGVGPLGDGFSVLPPLFLQWGTVPFGDTYIPVRYSALLAGLDLPLGRIPYMPVAMDRSVAGGEAALKDTLSTITAGEKTRVVGMSLGSIVVDNVRVALEKTQTSPDLSFLLIGNPLRPDGGFLTRFGSFTIPILNVTFGRGKPDGDFPTTDITFEYDFMSDFPTYFNPLAIANAAAGLLFTHIFPGYVFADPDDPDAVRTTVGNTTYVRLPSDLPMLFPLKVIASIFGAQRIVSALDAVLRPIIDMAYDRSGDPSVVRPFELQTPQDKIDEAIAKMPAAFEKARTILFGTAPKPHTDESAVTASVATDAQTSSPATEVEVAPVADSEVVAPHPASVEAEPETGPETASDGHGESAHPAGSTEGAHSTDGGDAAPEVAENPGGAEAPAVSESPEGAVTPEGADTPEAPEVTDTSHTSAVSAAQTPSTRQGVTSDDAPASDQRLDRDSLAPSAKHDASNMGASANEPAGRP